MSHGWNGADPVQQTDPASYELATEFLVGAQAITVTAVRVWEGASPGTFNNRMGRLWTTAGALLGSAAMPTTLPAGWSQYNLATPVVIQANTRVVVSYSTGGNYGALVHGLDSDVVSADGAVTAESGAHGIHGNGSFNTSATNFPTTASGNNSFYGIDLVYTIGGGTQPPTITGMTVTAVGALATATILATDPVTLLGATYSFDWGDGHIDSGLSSNVATHTYAASGDYAVLGSVTNYANLSAYAARPVTILIPGAGFDPVDIMSRITSLALASGLFASVAGHEPASPPPAGLTAGLWLQAIGPARKVSGLSATAGLVTYTLRIYNPTTTGNLDQIEPAVGAAASTMISQFSGDFTLGGAVFVVDLLGANGAPLAAKAGYFDQAGQLFRIMDVTIPLVIDNVWAQASGL